MGLSQDLKDALPALTDDDFRPGGTIILQDDSDGLGAYIAVWNHSSPLPEGFKLGK